MVKLALLILVTGYFSLHSNAQCFGNSADDGIIAYASHSSGNRSLDEFMDQEKSKLESFLHIRVDLLFSHEHVINAFSFNNPHGYYDGSVVFTMDLFEDVKYQTGKIKSVLAHECGHIAQFKYGGFESLPTRECELFADYIAGVYLGLSENDGSINIDNYWESFKTQSDYGDYSFGNPNHHGTPKQRFNATMVGSTVNGTWFHGYFRVPPYRSFYEIYKIGLDLSNSNLLSYENLFSDKDAFQKMLRKALSHWEGAIINNIWVDHNVYENGYLGMRVHIDCNVYCMNSSIGNAVTWFYFDNGTPLKDFNGSYTTSNGTVSCRSSDLKFTYRDSWFRDVAMFIPYSELHMPSGQYQLKCVAGLFRGGTQIGNDSSPVYFSFKQ